MRDACLGGALVVLLTMGLAGLCNPGTQPTRPKEPRWVPSAWEKLPTGLGRGKMLYAPGGWMVRFYVSDSSWELGPACFVPDPGHKWLESK